MDESIITDGHIRVLPDQVSGAEAGGKWLELCKTMPDIFQYHSCFGCLTGYGAQLMDHITGVFQVVDVTDPDGVLFSQGFYLLLYIFLFIGNDEIGLQAMHGFDVYVLGAADAFFIPEPAFGVNAEFGNACHFGFQSEVIQ
jgi:hypothetical protein